MGAETETGTGTADRRLRVAGWCFAAASLLHIADHLRRGQGSVTDVLDTLGSTALVVQVVTVTLVLTGHRLAPLVATVSGFALAVGFAAAHWLPRWSDASDPVWEIDSWRPLSYVASAAEIVTAVVLGVAGAAARRARRHVDATVAAGPTPTVT